MLDDLFDETFVKELISTVVIIAGFSTTTVIKE
jgi:hypothetical protein